MGGISGDIVDDIPEFKKKYITKGNAPSKCDNVVYANMNETQLKVALNNAIANEDYHVAEVIRKELERFR